MISNVKNKQFVLYVADPQGQIGENSDENSFTVCWITIREWFKNKVGIKIPPYSLFLNNDTINLRNINKCSCKIRTSSTTTRVS